MPVLLLANFSFVQKTVNNETNCIDFWFSPWCNPMCEYGLHGEPVLHQSRF